MRVLGTTAPRISTPPDSHARCDDVDRGRAEEVAGHLLQDQPDAERHQQGVQRPVVHPLDQRDLEQDAEQATHHEADDQRDQQ